MKIFRGIAAVFMVLKIVESIDVIQSELRYSSFMKKVDHTDYSLDNEDGHRYTIYLKDGSVIKRDHDIYRWDFGLF